MYRGKEMSPPSIQKKFQILLLKAKPTFVESISNINKIISNVI